MRMKFGKHKGEELADIPILYLRWAVDSTDSDDLRDAIQEELDARWPHEVEMPFGKHKGNPLGSIPISYLEWLVSNATLRDHLEAAVSDMLGRDDDGSDEPWEHQKRQDRREWPDSKAPPPSAVPRQLFEAVREIVKRGFRASAVAHHPDHGGTDEKMREVISAREWLEKNLHL